MKAAQDISQKNTILSFQKSKLTNVQHVCGPCLFHYPCTHNVSKPGFRVEHHKQINVTPIFNFRVVVFETICAIFTDNTEVSFFTTAFAKSKQHQKVVLKSSGAFQWTSDS